MMTPAAAGPSAKLTVRARERRVLTSTSWLVVTADGSRDCSPESKNTVIEPKMNAAKKTRPGRTTSTATAQARPANTPARTRSAAINTPFQPQPVEEHTGHETEQQDGDRLRERGESQVGAGPGQVEHEPRQREVGDVIAEQRYRLAEQDGETVRRCLARRPQRLDIGQIGHRHGLIVATYRPCAWRARPRRRASRVVDVAPGAEPSRIRYPRG